MLLLDFEFNVMVVCVIVQVGVVGYWFVWFFVNDVQVVGGDVFLYQVCFYCLGVCMVQCQVVFVLVDIVGMVDDYEVGIVYLYYFFGYFVENVYVQWGQFGVVVLEFDDVVGQGLVQQFLLGVYFECVGYCVGGVVGQVQVIGYLLVQCFIVDFVIDLY